ncbi:MAG: PLP-dependent aminotransferase family protein [Silicimonas sp.]
MRQEGQWYEAIASRKGPRYTAIVEALSEAIQSGHLNPGDRVPPQRELAKLIGVTPGTTARAYAIASNRGLISGETGRGTHVIGHANFPRLFEKSNTSPPVVAVGQSVLSPPRNSLQGELANLALPRAPAESVQQVMSEGLAKIASDAAVRSTDYRRYLTDFAPRHCDIGAEWLRQLGFKASAEDVMLTAGAHIGIFLILTFQNLQTMPILTSGVTYGGMRHLQSITDRQMIEIEHDDEGLTPRSLEAACRRGMGKMLFVQTAVHNPLSIVTPPHRREEIAAIARRYDLIVIEDNAALVAPPDDGPAIAELIPERTFLISSTSKSLTPSAPLGIVMTPPGWANQLVTSMRMHHLYPSVLNYALIEHLLQEDLVRPVWQENADIVNRRAEIAQGIFGREDFRPGRLSHYGWLGLPKGWHPDSFTTAARHAGIEVGASLEFTLIGAKHAQQGIRLSLTGPETDEDLSKHLHTLKTVLSR